MAWLPASIVFGKSLISFNLVPTLVAPPFKASRLPLACAKAVASILIFLRLPAIKAVALVCLSAALLAALNDFVTKLSWLFTFAIEFPNPELLLASNNLSAILVPFSISFLNFSAALCAGEVFNFTFLLFNLFIIFSNLSIFLRDLFNWVSTVFNLIVISFCAIST